MLVCPNCNHPNPDGAAQCEACYTPLPATTNCPSCGTPVQTDASFCGQCGFNLRSSPAAAAEETVATDFPSKMPDLVPPEPLVQPEILVSSPSSPEPMPVPATEVTVSKKQETSSGGSTPPPSQPPRGNVAASSQTQLQQQKAQLLHIQTNTLIELPQNLSVIHIGKANERIPPDIDVAGFPNSEIVSRVHANIRVEADAYYIEDVGSSNGTYVNNLVLAPGNRHRLRAGDRIALGKGDLVSFLFQVA